MAVGIIGAGVSGIAMCQKLQSRGIDYTCFEARDDVGGIWHYADDPNVASVYKNCTLNHSTRLMEYSFNPMLGSERFLHRREYHDYLLESVNTANVRDNIRFSTRIISVEFDDGVYVLKDSNGEQHHLDYLCICTGFYAHGMVPQAWQDNYIGKLTHSAEYRSPVDYVDQKVLVVGSGSSAIQIACDLSNVAREVVVSARKMPFVIPKFVFGRPYNRLLWKYLRLLSLDIQSYWLELLLYIANGRQQRYGLPKASGRMLSGRLPISSQIFDYCSTNQLRFLPGITEIKGHELSFADQSSEEFDHVILATGYRVDLGYLKGFDFDFKDNYGLVASIKQPGLFFCGFLQPVGPVPPVVTRQAELIANLIDSTQEIPSPQQMQQETEAFINGQLRHYGGDFTGRVELRGYFNWLSQATQSVKSKGV